MLQSSSRGGSPWSGGVFSLVGGGVLLGPGGGGFSLVQGGLCLVREVLPGGCLPGLGGSPCSRGVLPAGGVCLVQGGFSGDPPVNRITDMCKNITLATTSLRPVKMYGSRRLANQEK